MGKRKSKTKQFIPSVGVTVFVAVVLVLKWIGDSTLWLITQTAGLLLSIEKHVLNSSRLLLGFFQKMSETLLRHGKKASHTLSKWRLSLFSNQTFYPKAKQPVQETPKTMPLPPAPHPLFEETEKALRPVWQQFLFLLQSWGILTKKTLRLFRELRIPLPRIPRLPKAPKNIRNASRFIGEKVTYFFSGVVVVSAMIFFYQSYIFVKQLPNPATLSNRDIQATTKLFDRNGTLLYEIYSEQNRIPVTLADIPKFVKDATIATEDKAFYTHQGFSFSSIFRAILHNLSSESLEGGSTITQQLIRSAFLSPERTYTRKAKEILLAMWAEQLYGKDEILEMYFNQVPYGGTAWGIEAAAQTYFGKSIKDVTMAEGAMLAGLPAGPTLYSPFGPYPDQAKPRQEEVLRRMVENGYLTREDAEKAEQEQLSFTTPRTPIAAPHFVMYIKELLTQEYGTRLVETGGLRVTTTLDLSIQELAQRAVTTNINNLKHLSVGNGAALVTDPTSGEVLAMVGSSDFFDRGADGNVNVTMSQRQPGSSIKVVTYAAALQHGFTAASVLEDAPVSYKIPGQPPYTPVNYDGRFHGRVPLRTALGSSYNIPAVKLLNRVGLDEMIATGRRMGITSWQDTSRYGLSLTLGGGEVTMVDMAKVYGTLADEGMRHDITAFLKITNYRGDTIPLPRQHSPQRAIPSSVAFILSSILSDNAARTPAFGPNSSLVIPGKTVAVKTGTSDNKRDNWTIGYTPDVVVTVWVGNNNNTPMHPLLTSGITGAAPIWQEIMKKLLEDKADTPFEKPKNVVTLPCFRKTEFFIAGTEPKDGCPRLSPLTPTPN